MKHLKSFRENSRTNLESDLGDIFLNLKDIGFGAEIDVNPQGINLIRIAVYKSDSDLFTWNDVGDYFERALEYLSSYGISTYKITIHYHSEHERGFERNRTFKTVEEFKEFMTQKFLSENRFGEISFSLSKN